MARSDRPMSKLNVQEMFQPSASQTALGLLS
jgi:hypothetical protein